MQNSPAGRRAMSPSFIERWAVSLGLIPETPPFSESSAAAALCSHPRPKTWDDVVEIDPHQWPAKQVEHRYRLVPTTCFNCESACGLLAYVDKETYEIRK